MTVQDFIKKAIQQDKRNVFEKTTADVNNLPVGLKNFYMQVNPVDVEITMGGHPVRFYPLCDLVLLQEDYRLKSDCFVFATCNSDPLFLQEEKVFSCYHGAQGAEKEFIANSFEDFLDLID